LSIGSQSAEALGQNLGTIFWDPLSNSTKPFGGKPNGDNFFVYY